MDKVVSKTAGVGWASCARIIAQIVILRRTPVTVETRHSRLIGHPVTWLEILNLGANLDHLSRGLVTQDNRVSDLDVAQLHLLQIVQIGATDSGGQRTKENL